MKKCNNQVGAVPSPNCLICLLFVLSFAYSYSLFYFFTFLFMERSKEYGMVHLNNAYIKILRKYVYVFPLLLIEILASMANVNTFIE